MLNTEFYIYFKICIFYDIVIEDIIALIQDGNQKYNDISNIMEEIQSHASDISKKVSEVSVLANKNDKELLDLDSSLQKYTVL